MWLVILELIILQELGSRDVKINFTLGGIMKENNTQVIEKITKFIQEEIEIWLEKER